MAAIIADINAQNAQQSEDKQGRQMAYAGIALIAVGFFVTRYRWWLWILGGAIAIMLVLLYMKCVGR